jgi:hypothetical protein
MKRIKRKAKNAFIPHTENDFQPRILKPRSLFCLAVILLVLKFVIFSWFFYFPKTAQFAIVTSSQLIDFANQARIESGVSALKISPELVEAAQAKAQDMISKGYFAHISPEGVTPRYWVKKAGYNYIAAGENLARGFSDSKFVHQAWMNSPSHKENILDNKYQEIGMAIVEGEINGKKTVIAVQFFGRARASQPVVSVVKPTEVPEEPVVVSETQIQTQEIEPTQLAEVTTEPEEPIQVESIETTGTFLGAVSEKSENAVQKFYFIILGILVLVLLLTIFINIRTQYPKTIFTTVTFIILIAGLTLFNSQEFLNRGLEVLSAII